MNVNGAPMAAAKRSMFDLGTQHPTPPRCNWVKVDFGGEEGKPEQFPEKNPKVKLRST